MDSIQIRYCIENDFAAVFRLLKQLWTDQELNSNALRTVFNNALQSDRQKYIVALIDNNIAGFCSLTIKNNLWQAGNLAHIDELIVDRQARGTGIGARLMAEITGIAKANNCKRIELDSAFHRKDAHRFYESMGYENRAYLFSKEI